MFCNKARTTGGDYYAGVTHVGTSRRSLNCAWWLFLVAVVEFEEGINMPVWT